MSETTRDKLRQRFLDRYSSLVPQGPTGKVSEGTRARRPYVRSDERAIGYVPYAKGELPDPLPATLVAFYLPQFHTIPENDEWWGKGFTEWRNVTRALPQFEGHYQPKLPGDLGFYDLRNPDVMREQARLAREYGISAFCFYFYWFGGKTLLETPLRNWLNDKSIDLQFCLCWANEKWTRTWDGRGDEILIDQKHSPEDDIAFIEHVAEYMRDPRYLRIDGKPVLLVYRPGLLPDAKQTSSRWRNWCRENEIGEIHLAYVQSFERPDPKAIGFNAAVEFPPNLSSSSAVTHEQALLNNDYKGKILDWQKMAQQFHLHKELSDAVHPGANCGWDNEARRPGKGVTYVYQSPRHYGEWLQKIMTTTSSAETKTIFINAWNEWAEGAILEPDLRFGYANLHNTRSALLSAASIRPTISTPCIVIHVWFLEEFEELLESLAPLTSERLVITTNADHATAVERMCAHRGLKPEVIIVENRGRDILPFLVVANRLLDEGFEFVLKLHTKRSTHLQNGAEWRRELVSGLAEIENRQSILAMFHEDRRLGLVTAQGHLRSAEEFIGGNRDNLDCLLQRMGLKRHESSLKFPAGSMYWIRLKALRPLLDTNLSAGDFEAEAGQIDGTMAHAIERAVGYCVESSGFRSEEWTMKNGSDSARQRREYPYAKS